MSRVDLYHEDCRAALRRLIDQGVRVHSVVCDPPYFLESVVKRFGKEGAAAAKSGSDGRFTRQSRGFMGKTWDGADPDGSRIAQDPEFWALVYEILLPGGYVLAFSSPRTGHWQACAMEQAGFVMHPFIGWAYGQGFPKAHAVDKASDSDWAGWYYGAQSLKPALEPIYMAQKPFAERTGFANVLKYGVGAVNIDVCRAEVSDAASYARNCSGDRGHDANRARISDFHMTAGSANELGRWPANLVHDGSSEVDALFPRDAGARAPIRGDEPSSKTNGIFGKFAARTPSTFHDDSGSAARFFNAFPDLDDVWVADLQADPIIYSPKASAKERVVLCRSCGQRSLGRPTCGCLGLDGKAAATESHPTVKPVNLMRWLCRLVTPAGGVVLDPFAGSGTTGQAARLEGFAAILVERDGAYAEDIRFRLGLSRKVVDPEVLELLGFPSDVAELI